MTASALGRISSELVFSPRTRFDDLGRDHVPFDELMGSDHFERLGLEAITEGDRGLAVVGGRGCGKSSLLAYVCLRLPPTHVALRVPVTGADDPTNVSAMAAVALSTALGAIELEAHQRRALDVARADERTTSASPAGIGGKLGGGPIPLEVSAETRSLSVELTTNALASDRLSGLDRLISILVYHGLKPVFVMEDTEAVVSGPSADTTAEAFFAGPVKAFLQEVDAPLLLAVQDHLTESAEFRELVPAMRRIDVPDLGDDAGAAIETIARRRLSDAGLDVELDDLISQGSVAALAAWYADSGRSLRHTLAALQSAAEHAENSGADRIDLPHAQAAIVDWREP